MPHGRRREPERRKIRIDPALTPLGQSLGRVVAGEQASVEKLRRGAVDGADELEPRTRDRLVECPRPPGACGDPPDPCREPGVAVRLAGKQPGDPKVRLVRELGGPDLAAFERCQELLVRHDCYDIGNSDMGIVRDIERSAHLLGLHVERAAARLDVTQAEAHVLVQLHLGGAQTVGELQRGFGHKRSTLTSVLDRLDLRGFVDRRVNPHDRRSYIVALTRSGIDAARDVNAVVGSLERMVRRRVTARDLEGFRAVADALDAGSDR